MVSFDCSDAQEYRRLIPWLFSGVFHTPTANREKPSGGQSVAVPAESQWKVRRKPSGAGGQQVSSYQTHDQIQNRQEMFSPSTWLFVWNKIMTVAEIASLTA
ncbi:hypothetical protein VFPPC_16398 [Pochonia chlamydosporia 170]|uniref:Uncharacterized protein n=1 Tax=Pochonia chlamydosporia 170 TaxID=1380566 RepID=A0A179FBS2_METCM|nr:hypothetical protein VFPPC_16398 [Pochonia chlamydosporia 170]OAQ62916.2 hypothetical protein VFPPC_16398 [Pochonia chlamydosporia 170]